MSCLNRIFSLIEASILVNELRATCSFVEIFSIYSFP